MKNSKISEQLVYLGPITTNFSPKILKTEHLEQVMKYYLCWIGLIEVP